mgnify:CR=1 FL=1
MRVRPARALLSIDDLGGESSASADEEADGDATSTGSSRPDQAAEPPAQRDDRPYVDPASVRFGRGVEIPGTPPPGHRNDHRSKSRSSRGQKAGDGDGHGKEFTGSTTPAPPPTVNREAERRAVEIAVRFAREQLGVGQVRDRQTDNVGWDLEFEYSTGYVEYAEIKGNSGNDPFFLTPNELAKARQHANYVLYQVANLANPRETVLRRYERFGEGLSDAHLRIGTYLVTGWLNLRREEFPIEP